MLKWFAKRRFNYIDAMTSVAVAVYFGEIGWWVVAIAAVGIIASALAEAVADR